MAQFNNSVLVHEFYSKVKKESEKLSKLFWMELKKWDSTVTMDMFYDKTVLENLLEQAREIYEQFN